MIKPLLERFTVSNNAFFSFEILSPVTVLVWNKALFSFEMLSLVSSPPPVRFSMIFQNTI